MKLIAIVLLLITGSAPNCDAQGDLKGIILDANSGKPVADVKVSVENVTKISDAQGAFRFQGVKTAGIQVRISHVSYNDTTAMVMVDNDVKIIRLAPRIVELQEVVVSSSKPSDLKFGALTRKPDIVFFGHIKGDVKVLKIKTDGHPDGLYLKNLNYYFVASGKTLGKGYRGASFLVKIYDCNDTTGLPGNELIETPIRVTSKGRNRWMSVDLSKFKIPLPGKTFFIGIEFTEDRTFETPQGMKQIEPCFGGTNEFGQEELCYTFRQGQWQKSAENIMINVDAGVLDDN